MLCVRESEYCCQSLSIVSTNLDFIFFLYFNFDVKFSPTDWKLMGSRMRIGNTDGDPFFGQTLCHNWVAKPRYHCIVSSPCFSGRMARNVWNIKTTWFWSNGQSKKAWKDQVDDRQIMKRDCISLKMSVFFFGTLPLQLITCIKMYRRWNLLLNVREIINILHKRW